MKYELLTLQQGLKPLLISDGHTAVMMLLSYFFLEGGLVGVYGTPILEVVALR